MELDSLLTGMNLTSAVAIFGVTSAAKVALKNDLKRPVSQRLLPLLPLMLGAIAGAVGAIDVNPATKPNQIIAGLMVASLAMVVFKVGKTTVFGHGIDKNAIEEAFDPQDGAAEKPADPASDKKE